MKSHRTARTGECIQYLIVTCIGKELYIGICNLFIYIYLYICEESRKNLYIYIYIYIYIYETIFN